MTAIYLIIQVLSLGYMLYTIYDLRKFNSKVVDSYADLVDKYVALHKEHEELRKEIEGKMSNRRINSLMSGIVTGKITNLTNNGPV